MRRADRLRASAARAACGFSLIELMVALAVFALVVLALLHLAGENTRSALVAEEATLAGVVADNRAVEAMLAPPGRLAGADDGREQAGDREWHWTRTVGATEMDGIVRVEISVQPAGETREAAGRVLLRRVP